MEQQEERTKPAHKCGIYGIYGHAGSAACSQYHHWVCPSSGKRLAHDSQVMVKEFIKGREITVGVLGNAELTALPLVEVIPESRYDFFDYEAKYTPGATREVCPAEVEDAVREDGGGDQHHSWHDSDQPSAASSGSSRAGLLCTVGSAD